MNSLLLVLVMNMATIAPMNQTPQLSIDQEVPSGSGCSYNQIHAVEYFYEYPGGPSCGYRVIYCNKPGSQHGCITSYSNYYEYCYCP
jgi:hypothetical protein